MKHKRRDLGPRAKIKVIFTQQLHIIKTTYDVADILEKRKQNRVVIKP